MSPRVARALLAVYPPAWRRRYGAEVVELIASDPHAGRAAAIADLARGAVREWLWTAALLGNRSTERDRVLACFSRIVWSWAMFVIGLAIVQKTTEQWDGRAHLDLLNRNVDVFAEVSVVAFGAGLIAAVLMVPALVTALRHGGLGTARRPALTALAGSVSVIAVTAGIVVWAHQLDSAARNGGDSVYVIAVLGWGVVVVATAAAWSVAIGRLIRVAAPRRRVAIGAAWATVVSGAAMVAMTASLVVWYLEPTNSPTTAIAGFALMGGATVMALSNAVPGVVAAHRIHG